MNGSKGLLDSNVIIDASKGKISFEYFLSNYDYLYMSIISYVEVLGFKFENKIEEATISRIFEIIEIVNLDLNIANTAVDFRKMKKIKLPDALILASAKHLEADLITSNIDDFKNIDSSICIIQPY